MPELLTPSTELSELDLEFVAAGDDKSNGAFRGPRGTAGFRGNNFSGFRGPRGNTVIRRN
jgi:hypothetical protein